MISDVGYMLLFVERTIIDYFTEYLLLAQDNNVLTAQKKSLEQFVSFVFIVYNEWNKITKLKQGTFFYDFFFLLLLAFRD